MLGGTGGLECWNQAQVWLSWVSGMVFYRAVWLADWGPSTASLWRTASGVPPSWPGLASSSEAFLLPFFSGGSYDLPACLGDGSQAVQFLVKDDKTKQTEERATCHREPWQCLFTVCCSPAEATHTQLSSQGPWSRDLYRCTRLERPLSMLGQGGTEVALGGQTFRPSRQPSRVQSDAFTPT